MSLSRIAVLALGVLPVLPASDEGQVAPELGRVAWERDFDQALARGKAQHKPLFVLFQEVPG